MNTLLLAAAQANRPRPFNELFRYYPGQPLVGGSLSFRGGAFIDESSESSIDGHSVINIPSVNAGATITFDRPLDLAGKDFTLEWVSFNANNPTGYASEFALLASDNRYSGINVRYGDSGFGNRLQYGTDLSKLEHVYSANVTKSALSGKTSYHALVCRDGSIYVYLNGQRQNLATGTSSVYNKPSFPVGGDLSALRHIRLGWIDSTQPAMIGRVGRIRISEGARYLESYDPVAL